MKRPRSHIPVLCLVLIFPALGFAQERDSPTEQELESEKQAYEILDSIAEGIPGLRSADNRIHLTAALADLLWPKDEARARVLFETLKKEVNAVMANLDPTDQRSLNTLNVIQQQRREIIQRICRRDPEMALVFMRATRPPEMLRARSNDYANETNLELFLVSQVAQKQPELALKLARASLRKGVTHSLISVLINLASKNPEAAKTLHGEIVEKLKTEDITSNYEPANAAWSLLGSFQPPQANEDAYRSLVELLSSWVLSVKPDGRTGSFLIQNFSGQIPGYMTQFEKYAPARLAALKQWSQQVSRTMDPVTKVYQELNELMQKGTVEEIMALAGKYGPEQQSAIYQHASQKALAGGDANRARQIIMEFVTDGVQRGQMMDQLDNQVFWNSVNANKMAEARQTLDRVKNVEQRFQLLLALAANLISRNEKTQATALLLEATELVHSMPANSTKINLQLQLAQCYSSVDAQQSVALLQSIIALANQLVTAAATLDGFENSYLNEGEWMKRGHSNVGNLVNNIEQNLATLARVDVQGARTLSNQLERPEIRLTAQLEIAQSLLNRGRRANFRQLINIYPRRRH